MGYPSALTVNAHFVTIRTTVEQSIGGRTPISTATHVRRYLDVADPDAQALNLLMRALRASTRDRDDWPATRRIEEWIMAQLDLLGVEVDDALTHDDVLDVLASVHLVASRVPPPHRRARARRIYRTVAALLDSLEPDFIPELLRDTRRRKATSAAFAANLAQSRRAVVELITGATAAGGEVIDSMPAEVAADPDRPVTLRAAEAGAVVIGVLVVILVVAVTVAWIAYNDPAKDPESEDEEE